MRVFTQRTIGWGDDDDIAGTILHPHKCKERPRLSELLTNVPKYPMDSSAYPDVKQVRRGPNNLTTFPPSLKIIFILLRYTWINSFLLYFLLLVNNYPVMYCPLSFCLFFPFRIFCWSFFPKWHQPPIHRPPPISRGLFSSKLYIPLLFNTCVSFASDCT